ncbi:hypothetical protein PMI14_03693 [Acidovorax sp. CF316]|uniref:hypothetical protein n=1 Tax=Acidovorax sp. CF316 TaxID=1144317 RepID=UPI00026BDB94|nr:hypothetical protein [Acidovorax sp. CF316]EJE51597.1 hypothetical protein PMI14_03693 [Acidovorax sp. CF316]
MNDTLAVACTAAACLLALVHWAQATSTRAWGDALAGPPMQRKAWGLALGTLALQTAAATAWPPAWPRASPSRSPRGWCWAGAWCWP